MLEAFDPQHRGHPRVCRAVSRVVTRMERPVVGKPHCTVLRVCSQPISHHPGKRTFYGYIHNHTAGLAARIQVPNPALIEARVLSRDLYCTLIRLGTEFAIPIADRHLIARDHLETTRIPGWGSRIDKLTAYLTPTYNPT